jgi:hypothetical protein
LVWSVFEKPNFSDIVGCERHILMVSWYRQEGDVFLVGFDSLTEGSLCESRSLNLYTFFGGSSTTKALLWLLQLA